MTDRATYPAASLDELARCFMRAALAEFLASEANALSTLADSTNPKYQGPDISTSPSGAVSGLGTPSMAPDAAPLSRCYPSDGSAA